MLVQISGILSIQTTPILRGPVNYIETSVKLRPLAQLFVALEFKSSKYYKYSCGLNFRAPRFDLKLLVLQRSHIINSVHQKSDRKIVGGQLQEPLHGPHLPL